jgi:hypothetical protein
VVTDQPKYSPAPAVSTLDPDTFTFLGFPYTKGVGYGDTLEKATAAAIADYLAKKGTPRNEPGEPNADG